MKKQSGVRCKSNTMIKFLSATIVAAAIASCVPLGIPIAYVNATGPDVTTALAAVNNAASNEQMKAALETPALGLVLTQYNQLNSAGKLSVAEAVLVNRGTGFATVSEISTAFAPAVVLAAINTSSSADEMKSVLEASGNGLNLGTQYPSWLELDKTRVMQSIWEPLIVAKYSSISEVQTRINSEISSRLPIATVNIAGTAVAMQNAFAPLSIDKSQYEALSDSDKVWIANELISKRPIEGYQDLFSIEYTLQYDALPSLEIHKAKNTLTITYAQGDTAQTVRGQLSLPTLAGNQISVTWSSNNSQVINANGGVTRPMLANQQVTLTATFTKDSVQSTKDFVLTVLALDPTPAPLASDIVVTNNLFTTNDTVKINSLQAGDAVTVYAADGVTTLAQATVQPGNTSHTLTINQLRRESGQVKVSVTRQGMAPSMLVTKNYVAENAKAYLLENGSLDRTTTVKATITVKPTGDVPAVEKYVVFQLMNGAIPENIVVKLSSVYTTETLTADFDKPNNPAYSVKVLVLDAYDNTEYAVGRNLAQPTLIN
jgi:hypothetical protein